MDRIKLLCDISELNHLFRDSVSVENFLQRIVVMVTQHMKSDVCSIYLYDDDTDQLTLKATEGLSQDSIDHIGMKLGEGLTGKSLQELRTICVTKASKEPDYKLFVGCGEEPFENFLAVPITRGISRIGVLVVQRKKRRRFNEGDVLALKAVASQLANIIENAKFIMAIHSPAAQAEEARSRSAAENLSFVRGKPASQGFAFSQAHILDREKTFSSLNKKRFPNHYTIAQFDEAIEETTRQLHELQRRVEEKLSDAASLIFASHLLILKDNEFVGTMRKRIEQGTNPPRAILDVANQYMDIFAVSGHTYVREKVQDIEDLIVRLMGNLDGEFECLADYGNEIVIARELFPSDLLQMSSQNVQGVVLVSGGVTSHLAVLARSLQIPMVIAKERALLDIKHSTPILVDADTGNVYINPAGDIVESFHKRKEEQLAHPEDHPPAKQRIYTKDKTRIRLFANINLLNDLETARKMHCSGVGLYRTEFPFIIRSDFPSEQEQYIGYRKLVRAMRKKPVVFRTLDIGGDKILSYYQDVHEQNPTMGMRSIRFSLQNQRVFVKQIRAILRAGKNANLHIMFPMISSIDEFLQAKQIVRTTSEIMTSENVPHNENPKLGIMVELPSVVHLMEEFVQHADFFSIGTNDLVQFMLAVDRTNETVSNFYLPHHPAVLRSIHHVVKVATEHKKSVSLCGDMAHNPHYIPFLLGIGLRGLSVDPVYVPRVQQAIENTDLTHARQLAKELLAQHDTKTIANKLGIRD
ncbi:Phosphoenolpyruvate-protein phosphotransferase [Anaerohalosphaera lusitana]|uniref:phosphoenolpyruvate--protein phosphotransferase n=1 Tax=Anaerohalosphaera lusitana TaxID=1936003 RepID=A0A1U9NH46_9BACT|nr:phosphoenolpyruvate--protein phosphotransferase [Anaerohalosphaera lusitana]AQT67253.1 Phosphoenolpyruvate-protein phosphotransferase [Anaerohalosphaera lusitana]